LNSVFGSVSGVSTSFWMAISSSRLAQSSDRDQ
jgi:hypothetical protein